MMVNDVVVVTKLTESSAELGAKICGRHTAETKLEEDALEMFNDGIGS